MFQTIAECCQTLSFSLGFSCGRNLKHTPRLAFYYLLPSLAGFEMAYSVNHLGILQSLKPTFRGISEIKGPAVAAREPPASHPLASCFQACCLLPYHWCAKRYWMLHGFTIPFRHVPENSIIAWPEKPSENIVITHFHQCPSTLEKKLIQNLFQTAPCDGCQKMCVGLHLSVHSHFLFTYIVIMRLKLYGTSGKNSI